MAEYESLTAAMDARDELAEAEIRYRLLAEVFEEMPQLRGNLNPALERAKAEIVRLRATKPPKEPGKVVAFDRRRFKKADGRKGQA
ncbi:hypothetical protein A5715_00600 [Mycolicibacter heraklionensis]|nr:hypothetical protein A5715_00600 [Mycolicibacter heraklionensis]